MSKLKTDPIYDRALGAYLGLACGDAMGATVEFMSPKKIQKKYGVHRDIIGGGWLDLKAGYVTDDTQMSLALGDAIIEKQWLIAENVAQHFVKWLNSFPPDVGDTCRRGILRYKNQGEVTGPVNEKEAGNGACMRILPVVLACLFREDLLDDWILTQNHITHHNHLSDAGSVSIARMLRAWILDDPILALLEQQQLTNEHAEFNYVPYPGKATGYIVHTLQTVLHFFDNSNDFESCVVNTVNAGGDADTTGAIVGMLAGAKYGLEQVPARWLTTLEQKTYQTIHTQTNALLTLADQLAKQRPH